MRKLSKIIYEGFVPIRANFLFNIFTLIPESYAKTIKNNL